MSVTVTLPDVSSCFHSRDRQCHAGSIDVALRGDEPDCATFAARFA